MARSVKLIGQIDFKDSHNLQNKNNFFLTLHCGKICPLEISEDIMDKIQKDIKAYLYTGSLFQITANRHNEKLKALNINLPKHIKTPERLFGIMLNNKIEENLTALKKTSS